MLNLTQIATHLLFRTSIGLPQLGIEITLKCKKAILKIHVKSCKKLKLSIVLLIILYFNKYLTYNISKPTINHSLV